MPSCIIFLSLLHQYQVQKNIAMTKKSTLKVDTHIKMKKKTKKKAFSVLFFFILIWVSALFQRLKYVSQQYRSSYYTHLISPSIVVSGGN